MIIENCFEELESKHGAAFLWAQVKQGGNHFVVEAYNEITQGHPLYGMKLSVLAKSKKNDDVLFFTEHGQFVIIHLTHNKVNTAEYPKYKLLDTHQELKEYLEVEIRKSR